MVVVASGTPERTYLQSVNKVLSGIGENLVGALTNPTRRVSIAMGAVEAARDDIFYKKLWQWRREHMEIALVEDQMWYELPTNYHKMASSISLNRREKKVDYVDYGDLLLRFPDLRAFPPGSGVGGIASAVQLGNQADTFGEPDYYTIWQQAYIGFMKIPNAAFLEDEDDVLFAHYWRHAASLVSDYDDIGIPRELWSAHEMLASSRMKKVLEYPDWKDEKMEGLALLDERCGSRKEDQDINVYDSPIINYNE